MASSLKITNNSGASITIAGQTIANAGNYTFTASFNTVCQDVVLWLNMYKNSISIELNSVKLIPTNPVTPKIIELISNGTIVPA